MNEELNSELVHLFLIAVKLGQFLYLMMALTTGSLTKWIYLITLWNAKIFNNVREEII